MNKKFYSSLLIALLSLCLVLPAFAESPSTSKNGPDTEDLVQRIQFQTETVPKVKDYLQSSPESSKYAGMYVDSDGAIAIGIKENPSNYASELNKLKNIVGEKNKLKIVQVKYSEKELNSTHEKVRTLASQNKFNDFAILSIETSFKNQKVRIGITPYNNKNVIELKDRLNDDSIEIIEAEQNFDDARNTYTRPLEGGLEITNATAGGNCTGAFSAYDTSGNYYYITAGHCGSNGDSFTQGGSTFGSISKKVYGAYADAAAIKLTNTSYASWWLYVTASKDRHWESVQGMNDDVEGQYVCSSGKTSGYTCGTIQSVNYSAFFNLTWFTQLRTASYTSQPGDSGAPVFSGTTLIGVNKGHTSSGTAIYSHVGWVTQNLGIYVVGI